MQHKILSEHSQPSFLKILWYKVVVERCAEIQLFWEISQNFRENTNDRGLFSSKFCKKKNKLLVFSWNFYESCLRQRFRRVFRNLSIIYDGVFFAKSR